MTSALCTHLEHCSKLKLPFLLEGIESIFAKSLLLKIIYGLNFQTFDVFNVFNLIHLFFCFVFLINIFNVFDLIYVIFNVYNLMMVAKPERCDDFHIEA